MKPINLEGQRFGRWTVIVRAGNDHIGRVTWLCLCQCGEVKTIPGWRLRQGKTNSCGCWRQEWSRDLHLAHGEGGTRRGKRQTAEYVCWVGLRSRCLNPRHPAYGRYGGRGIRVHRRWLDSFENFIADMGRKPSSKHSIDRIDVNGDYEPVNCRWATALEQRHNRRDMRAA